MRSQRMNLSLAGAAMAMGVLAGATSPVVASPEPAQAAPAPKPNRSIRRSRWASIRANVGRNHPDYGMSPADHAVEKQHRAHSRTRRAAY